MKPLCLLYISPILLLGLAESCCVEPSSGLKRKWELWTRPFLRKRSVDIAQKRLLSILGLENFPRPGRHVIPHKFMLELYRNFSSGNYKGNQSYDMVPNTVVGIVDQGQSVCIIILDFFFVSVCHCLYLFCDVANLGVSRFFIILSSCARVLLVLRRFSFCSFPCRT